MPANKLRWWPTLFCGTHSGMGGARLGHEAFAQDGYLLLPALLNPAVTDFLWSYVQTKLACRLLGFGHGPSAHVLSAYGDPAFDGLLEYLRPRFEEASGLQLSSTFSFFRLYKRGDKLERHRDRPACEVAVSAALRTPGVCLIAARRQRLINACLIRNCWQRVCFQP